MAAHDLTVLSAPNFHSVLDSSIQQDLALVDRVLACVHLTTCYWSDEHCDCREVATVHHLASELEFCERHFQAVSRG
jgi:hypothetical protein